MSELAFISAATVVWNGYAIVPSVSPRLTTYVAGPGAGGGGGVPPGMLSRWPANMRFGLVMPGLASHSARMLTPQRIAIVFSESPHLARVNGTTARVRHRRRR